MNQKEKTRLLDELVEMVHRYLDLRKTEGKEDQMMKCGQEIQRLFKMLHQEDNENGES